MEVPLLPVNGVPIELERYTLRLSDIDRLEVIPEPDLLLNGFGIEVSGRCSVQRSAFLRDVDVDDFLGLDVEDRAEIERVGVLEIIDAGAESLLEPRAISVALIVTYRPC